MLLTRNPGLGNIPCTPTFEGDCEGGVGFSVPSPGSVSGSGSGAGAAVSFGTSAGMTWLDPNKSSTEKLIITAPQMVGAGIGVASSLGASWATAVIPVIGPVIAGVTIGLSMLFARKGPKQKTATTEIVNKVEPYLRQNVDAYLANPTPEGQRQAIENFNAGWQFVVEHCGIPEMGTPGRNCITERDRGGQWDWFALYADPIVNTPPRVPSSRTSSSGGSMIAASGTASGAGAMTSPVFSWPVLAGAGLLLLFVLLPGGDK